MRFLHVYGVHRSACKLYLQNVSCKRSLSVCAITVNKNAIFSLEKSPGRGNHILRQPKDFGNLHSHYIGLQQRRHNSTEGGEEIPTVYIPTFDEMSYEWIEYMHLQTGLPWWLTIIAATIAMRTVIHLPLAIMTQRTMARFENVQPEINGYVELFRQKFAIEAKEKKWRPKYAAATYDKGVRHIIKVHHHREKCGPLRALFPIGGHLVTWYGMSVALGQMAGGSPKLFGTEMDVDFIPEFINSGSLWFSNLTVPDPVFLLPLANFIVSVVLIECWSLRRGPETKTFQRLKMALRGVSLVTLPIATILPASIQLFWLTSSLCGLGQFFLLRQPQVRRFVGVPKSPSEMTQPLTEMTQIFRARYLAKKMF